MKQISYNPSFRAHLITGIITGIWLVVFLILIAPFDASDLSFFIRIILLPLYGVLFLVTYLIIWPFQSWLFKLKGEWHIGYEVLVILLCYIINLLLTYSYYKTDLINGTFSFIDFSIGVYLPIVVIISMPLLAARWYFGKKGISETLIKAEKLILRGDNKDDVLQVLLDHVICISSAQNYMEVYYTNEGIVKKKLLRSTLKNMYAQVPSFVQSHRSHIFNPNHFIKWNSNSEILVGPISLPVSKNFRKNIEEKYNLIPNL